MVFNTFSFKIFAHTQKCLVEVNYRWYTELFLFVFLPEVDKFYSYNFQTYTNYINFLQL